MVDEKAAHEAPEHTDEDPIASTKPAPIGVRCSRSIAHSEMNGQNAL